MRFRNTELQYFGFCCAAAGRVALVVEDGLRTERLRRRRRGVSWGELSEELSIPALVRPRDITRLLRRVTRVPEPSFRRVGDSSSSSPSFSASSSPSPSFSPSSSPSPSPRSGLGALVVAPAPSPAACVVSGDASKAQATALRVDGRQRWVCAWEGVPRVVPGVVPEVVERAVGVVSRVVALVVVLSARRRRRHHLPFLSGRRLRWRGG